MRRSRDRERRDESPLARQINQIVSDEISKRINSYVQSKNDEIIKWKERAEKAERQAAYQKQTINYLQACVHKDAKEIIVVRKLEKTRI